MLLNCIPSNDPKQDIVLALFFAGLLGSFTHCLGMCSPFVISQISTINNQSSTAGNILSRLKGLALLPYHCGRITTYTLLGVLASFMSAQVMAYDIFKSISILLLVLAGILFLASAIGHLKWFPFPNLACGIPRLLTKFTKPFFISPIGWRGYILGVMLGFIPCGLVFAAVMAVTATGNPILAAIAMVAFGLGTIPALIAVSLGSRLILNRHKKWLQPFSTTMMIFNSFLIFFIAGGWTI
jgi:sulfite exporter TauE/SafE